MSADATAWVADKLVNKENVKVLGNTPEGFLRVDAGNQYVFTVAVIGVPDRILRSHVAPLFAGTNKPELVVNVPSKALWTGPAIDAVHSAGASFGSFGDVSRASRERDAGAYRNKNMRFFIEAMQQHTNVADVTYAFDKVFSVRRKNGASLTVAIVESYNLSAEEVRDTVARFGKVDLIVKSGGYGCITAQAETAAQSVGTEVMDFGGLMSRLRK